MKSTMRMFLVTAALLLLQACGGDGDNNGSTPSNNADLSSLILDDAPLTPAFASATTSYTADVTGGTLETRVTAITANSRARLTVNGTATPSGTPSDPIELPVGDTTIEVVVTAESGSTRTYQVTVTRPTPGNEATLSSLELTLTGLDQIFDATFFTYTAGTGYLGTSTRVIAEPSDPLADALRLDDVRFESGEPSHWVALAANDTSALTIEVTAEDDKTTLSYDVLVDRSDLGSLAQRAYIKAFETSAGDRFGSDLTLIDDWLLAGAPFEQSNATGIDGNQSDNSLTQAGAAYLYDRISGVWGEAHYLKASNTDPGDLFGWAVAASNDLLVVGAPGEQSLDGTQSDNSGSATGAIYIFDQNLLPPVQTAYLKADNADSLDRFGTAIDVDQTRVLVGAEVEASNARGVNGDGQDNSMLNAGAAYLFAEDGAGGWQQIAYLKASNTDSNQRFGSAVALDGETLAVGARQESSSATGINGDQSDTGAPGSGSVYVFAESAAASWAQSAYIKASNTQQEDDFGFALALDDSRLAVGAPGEDSGTGDQNDNSTVDSGAVYLFDRDADGQWSQSAYIKAPTPGLRDFFGASVAVIGNLLAVGAPGERSGATGINGDDLDQSAVDSGAIYVFEEDDTGAWQQIAYIKASNTDASDLFGRNLALDRDTLAAGAPLEQSGASGIDGNQSDNSAAAAGAIYVFR